MAEQRGRKISELPVATTLTGVQVLVGNQDGVTKQFPVELLSGNRQPPYFQPLSGKSVSIPLPDGVLSATVAVLNSEGVEVSVVVKHQAGTVQLESSADMRGLTARLMF